MTTITAVVIHMVIMIITLSMFAMIITDIAPIMKSTTTTIIMFMITIIITDMMIVGMLSILVIITRNPKPQTQNPLNQEP